jgi:thiol:disulfide interchange protein
MKMTAVRLGIYLVTVIVILAIAGTFLASRSAELAIPHSAVAGLAAMREMTHLAVPYDLALANDKPTLVEFYADWCTTCQGMAPILHHLHQQYGEAVNFVMLNIDDPQWAEQIDHYQVTGVPKLLFLDADRNVAKTFVGKVPETVLQQVFEQISA